MALARKLDFDDEVVEAPALDLREAGELTLGRGDNELHARRLQQNLHATYSDTPIETKLPFVQRVLVIVGLNAVLWSMTGGLIYLLIG